MKKILPIVIVFSIVLAGLGAGALSITEQKISADFELKTMQMSLSFNKPIISDIGDFVTVFLTDSEEVYKNMYRFVVSIDGNTDPVFVSKALKRMHIQDIKKIISEINKGEYGVNPRFIFECPECSHNETMAIPMDVSFFSVS